MEDRCSECRQTVKVQTSLHKNNLIRAFAVAEENLDTFESTSNIQDRQGNLCAQPVRSIHVAERLVLLIRSEDPRFDTY